MYCRNCANALSEYAIACPKCGVPPKKGKNFCYQCAKPTVVEAIICVSCGVSLANTPLSSINKREYLTLWGKYSYSTYVFILLLSLLPFVDLSCNEKKVYTINGYELTVGKERTYTKTYNLGYYGSYEKEKTEVISNIFIQLFYAVIIAIIVILLLKKSSRFRYAQLGTMIAFALLITFIIGVNTRFNKEKSGMIELSYGYGYWLTLLTLIATFGIIFLYRKEFNDDEEPTAILEPIPPVQQSSPPVIEQQPIVHEEIIPAVVPVSNIETLQAADSNVEAYPEYAFEETRSNSKKYIIMGVIAVVLIAIIYFVATNETSADATVQTPVETTAPPLQTTIPTPTYQPPVGESPSDVIADSITTAEDMVIESANSKVTPTVPSEADIKKSLKGIRYLYAANGGLTIFYTDGSVRTCPHCDYEKSSLDGTLIYPLEGNYKLVENKMLTVQFTNGRENVFDIYDSENPKEFQTDWAIIDYKVIRKLEK